MDIERVELLTTLKADRVWRKGTIFDVKDGPIPPAIIAEVRANKGNVRILGPNENLERAVSSTKKAPVTLADLKEMYPVLIAELTDEIVENMTDSVGTVGESFVPDGDVEKESAPLTGGDILRMSLEQILDLLKDEEDFESLKNEKRTVLVGIARKRLVKNDQS